MHIFLELACAKNNCCWSCDILRKLRQLDKIPPPTKYSQFEVVIPKNKNKYIQEDCRGFISRVYISHMDCETHGSYTKSCILCDVHCEHIIFIDWVLVNKSKLGRNCIVQVV